VYGLLKGVYGAPGILAEPGCDLYVLWSFGLKGVVVVTPGGRIEA